MLELAKALAAAARDAEKVLSEAASKEKQLKGLNDSIGGARETLAQVGTELKNTELAVVEKQKELAALEAKVKVIKERLAGI